MRKRAPEPAGATYCLALRERAACGAATSVTATTRAERAARVRAMRRALFEGSVLSVRTSSIIRATFEATKPRSPHQVAAGAFCISTTDSGGRMSYVESRNRATSDPGARRDVVEEIEARGIEDVLLWFTDLEGHLKSFAITIGEVEGALDDGMGFDGSSITGFNAIEESDMVAIPDPETFTPMPWKEGEARVARMICDVSTPGGQPYEGDPRYVLRRALERMEGLGYDTFNVGPELEYFLFKDDTGTETLDEGGYFAMTTMDAASELRQETVRALETVGIPIEYVHHEVGPSQHEIDMRFAPALTMADHTVTYRLIVKEIAKKAGYHATFMPKPIFGENGSGIHTHQSLFSDGRNAFFDGDDEWHLSGTGKAFIAGQLRHAREISTALDRKT